MVSEIIDKLFIGTLYDCINAKPNEYGLIICVAELNNFSKEEKELLLSENKTIFYMPFVDYSKAGPNLEHSRAKLEVLEHINEMIEYHLDRDRKVLVHCASGVERSPLAVIWYLHRYLQFNLEEAYGYVKRKRPIIENRLEWINEQAAYYLREN